MASRNAVTVIAGIKLTIFTVVSVVVTTVLAMIMVWGNKHSSPNGLDTQLVSKSTHKKVEPVVVDAKTHEPIVFSTLTFAGGPGNTPEKIKVLKERNYPLVPAD